MWVVLVSDGVHWTMTVFFQARLWMQVMRQLRHGVKLKKMEHLELEQPREFELTPYEMLMEDISSRRYTLNKVLVSPSQCTIISVLSLTSLL